MIAVVAFKLNEIMPWIMEGVVIFIYKQVSESRTIPQRGFPSRGESFHSSEQDVNWFIHLLRALESDGHFI